MIAGIVILIVLCILLGLFVRYLNLVKFNNKVDGIIIEQLAEIGKINYQWKNDDIYRSSTHEIKAIITDHRKGGTNLKPSLKGNCWKMNKQNS